MKDSPTDSPTDSQTDLTATNSNVRDDVVRWAQTHLDAYHYLGSRNYGLPSNPIHMTDADINWVHDIVRSPSTRQSSWGKYALLANFIFLLWQPPHRELDLTITQNLLCCIHEYTTYEYTTYEYTTYEYTTYEYTTYEYTTYEYTTYEYTTA